MPIGLEEKKLTSSSIPNNRIETLDDHRTVIRLDQSTFSSNRKSDRWTNKINDGHYLLTTDSPPILIYYLRLPFQTLIDAIRIQSDPDVNLLTIFIEQQERNAFVDEEQNERLIVRSTSRLCRLPKDYHYDYTRLRVQFLKENFIRIEIPTLNET